MWRLVLRVGSALGIAIIVAIGFVALRGDNQRREPAGTPRGASEAEFVQQYGGPPLLRQMPTITLERIGSFNSGQQPAIVSLPSTSGQAMLVVFVSSACAACMRDMEFWIALRRKAKERNILFVVASIDQDRAKAETWARDLQSAHPAVQDVPVLFSRSVGPALDIRFVPYYLLIDQSGIARQHTVGLTGAFTSIDERSEHLLGTSENANSTHDGR